MSQTIGNDASKLHQHDFIFITTHPDMSKDDGDANELNFKSSIPPANTPRNVLNSYNVQAETDKILNGVMNKLQSESTAFVALKVGATHL